MSLVIRSLYGPQNNENLILMTLLCGNISKNSFLTSAALYNITHREQSYHKTGPFTITKMMLLKKYYKTERIADW